MGSFSYMFKYGGEPYDEYKYLPTLIFDDEEDIEEYVDEAAWDTALERYDDSKYSRKEWLDIVEDMKDYIKETEFGRILTKDEAENIYQEVYDFEDETGIPTYIDRREYGSLQVCVEKEERLNEEQIKKVQGFFTYLKNKYDLDEID